MFFVILYMLDIYSILIKNTRVN